MNSKLLEAVEIFKTLGWENVTEENTLQLPTGSAEQKKIALQGLQKGKWSEWGETGKQTWGAKSLVNVNHQHLALFAIRIGVSANRASQILKADEDQMMTVQVVSARGANFIAEFIRQSSKLRTWTHSSSRFGHIAVYLVHELGLEIPPNIDYLKDWVAFAALSMGQPAEISEAQKIFFPLDILLPRMTDHLTQAIQFGIPATGPFARVFLTAVQQGILPRDNAIELAFFALDASARPGDKKVWAQTLETLSITDLELQDKAHAIIPQIAAGETTILNLFATRLIPLLDDESLIELLIAAFSTSQKKAIQLVLKTALGQNSPENAQSLAPWLSQLVENSDKSIEILVDKLSQHWQITLEKPEETIPLKSLWRETPDVWHVPQFEIGEISREALLEHLSYLLTRPAVVTDIYTEQFFAVLIAQAYQNEEDTRTFLKGIKGQQAIFRYLEYWLEGFPTESWYYERINNDSSPPLSIRNTVLHAFIGKVPCLLSTPSKWDLSITAPDLVASMMRYQQEKRPIWEADLWLALARLDLSTVTSEQTKALATLNLPVRMPSGKIISKHAGQVVLTYIQYPIQKPSIDLTKAYVKLTFDLTNALPELPKRLQNGHTGDELYAHFPLFGEASLVIDTLYTESNHNLGLILRQIARRAQPLPPGGMINLFALQRSPSNHAAEDCFTAVIEAWERGLLRPNIADVKFLDWTGKEPTHLALFVSALGRIAEEGLLSVVWPILDDLVKVSLNATRLLSGTAEIVQLILTLLPEVELAIQKGLTDISALDLPGVRTLAKKSTKSKAVQTAQSIVAALPQSLKVKNTVSSSTTSKLSDQDFANIWLIPATTLPYLDDGAEITIDWLNSDPKTKQFLFTLTIPNQPNSLFQVSKAGWVYDLHYEKQLKAYQLPQNMHNSEGTDSEDTDSTDHNKHEVWLYWDEISQTLVFSQYRNRYGQNDGPLSGPRSLVSSTLLIISLALLAQDDGGDYHSLQILLDDIKEGCITADTVLKTIQILLQYPVVNPGKLLRKLEKDNTLLSTLWPILTQSIQQVGSVVASSPLPTWINRILDIAIRNAPYLKMAMEKGLIPAPYAQWLGLEELAQSKGKSVAITKAQQLSALLGL